MNLKINKKGEVVIDHSSIILTSIHDEKVVIRPYIDGFMLNFGKKMYYLVDGKIVKLK